MEIIGFLFLLYVVGWVLARLYDEQSARNRKPYDYWEK